MKERYVFQKGTGSGISFQQGGWEEGRWSENRVAFTIRGRQGEGIRKIAVRRRGGGRGRRSYIHVLIDLQVPWNISHIRPAMQVELPTEK